MSNKLFNYINLCMFINCVKCFNLSVLHLPEGSNCTYEDIPGKCVNFFKCERLIVDMPEKKYPPICSFDGRVPIVCCTSCRLVDNINNAIRVSTGDLIWKNGVKSHDKCLEYSRLAYDHCKGSSVYTSLYLRYNKTAQCHTLGASSPAGAGGVNSKRGEIPHMALLGYGSELESVEWICGGSLISENFILTAAHCTKSDLLGPVTYAALGILRRSDPTEIWQRYRIKTIIPHPEYRPPVKYHDIALLETEKRIKLSRLVIPACLPNPSLQADNPDYKSLLSNFYRISAAGWGATGFRSPLADTLQIIVVDAFTEQECLEQFPSKRSGATSNVQHGYNKTIQLCLGDKNKPVDTCEGDSGGPLQRFNDWCMFTVLGVTSFGGACGFAGNAGIYTRVTHYVPWIEDIVWK